MSNILAALVGGLGAGAQSLGASRFQEQEQRRREEAAEQMRIRTAQEQGEQRRQLAQTADADRLRQRTAGANSIRALFPDFEAPDGDFDPQVVLRGMLDREVSKRQGDREEGLTNRLNTTLGGRMSELESRIESMRDVNSARAEEMRARAAAAGINAGANATRADKYTPGNSRDPDSERMKWVMTRVKDLMDPRGDALDVQSAKAQAERDAAVLFGGGQPAPPPRPAPGTNLFQGISGGRPPLDSFRR
jgi:hypothetical protein